MSMEITRLHLASLAGIDGGRWPVHGFVITHPGGAVLVDTGVGGPPDMLDDWRVVNRSVADALAELDMSPADIGLVINTHLHFDHCGQNAVFRHAPVYVQRAELSRAKRESPELCEWFDFMNARFELLDGDAEVLPGLEVIATPGHTEGHQCVVVRGDQDGPGGSGGPGGAAGSGGPGAFDLLIGDAAYTPRQYAAPDLGKLPAGQASDVPAWRESVRRVQSLRPDRVHFCHHTDIVHN
jgi:N-acyl homoserine lactone hydrolase